MYIYVYIYIYDISSLRVNPYQTLIPYLFKYFCNIMLPITPEEYFNISVSSSDFYDCCYIRG